MDTNQIAELLTSLRQQRTGMDGQTVLAAIGLIAAALLSLATMIIAHLARVTAKTTAEEVVKIHAAVNSKSTAMEDQIEQLQAQVGTLSAEKAVAEERQRGQALKDASAAAAVVAASAPVPLTEARLMEILNARDVSRP